jgi:MFS family permease
MNDQFAEQSPPLDRRWSARASTAAVFFVNGLGIGSWAACIAGLKARIGLTDGQVSVVLLMFAAGAVTAMPLAGWAGSRVSTGRAAAAAGFAFAIALFTPSCASTLTLLCIAAAAFGASNGALDVLMNAHASVLEHRWGSPIMSSLHATFSLGGMTGALLGGALASAGTVAQLGAASGIGLLAIVTVSAFLGIGAAASARTPVLSCPNKALLALGLIALLCMMIEGAVADWSGILLAQSGMTVGAAAVGYAAFSMCMVAGRLGGDWLVARLGSATILRMGGAAAAVGLVFVACAPGSLSGAVGFGLVGLGLSNVIPTVFSAAARTGASAAAGVAATATAGYGGFLIGPVVMGTLATIWDLRWGMGLLAVAAIVVSAVAVVKPLHA